MNYILQPSPNCVELDKVFEELFEDNNWQPFQYKGRRVCIEDDFAIPIGESLFELTIEKTKSEWEQGIFLKGNGYFVINDEKKETGIYLWESTTPRSIRFMFNSKVGDLKVWNIWRIDKGPMQYGHNGSAMYFEEILYGKRYCCNDGYPDDDFDDLIFTLKIIEGQATELLTRW